MGIWVGWGAFESSVNSYGNEATNIGIALIGAFESSVNSYGNEAEVNNMDKNIMFESSVNSYGNEAHFVFETLHTCLRVV